MGADGERYDCAAEIVVRCDGIKLDLAPNPDNGMVCAWPVPDAETSPWGEPRRCALSLDVTQTGGYPALGEGLRIEAGYPGTPSTPMKAAEWSPGPEDSIDHMIWGKSP